MAKYELILTSDELETTVNVSSPISLSVLDVLGPRGIPGYSSVVEYSNLASFPVTGEPAVLYLAVDTVNYYRWNGASYDLVLDTAKFAGIETGATADQTGAEIKSLYEAEADTNAYTDAEKSKLAGVEASADVTDTANVTAAGALMDSELTSEASIKALNQGVATTDSPTFVNTTLTGYLGGPATFTIDPAAIGDNTGKVVIAGDLQVDGTTTTVNSTTVEVGDKNLTLGSNAANDTENHEAGVSVYRPVSGNSSLKWNETLDQWESSHAFDITGDLTLTGTVDGRDVAADGTKLDGIEAGATADQTGAEIKALYEVEANAFTDAQFTKLAGIETGATADQTGAEIKTALFAEADTNNLTDTLLTKLNGIEALADVTDTINVTAAGALMDSELTSEASVKAINQQLTTTSNVTFGTITVSGTVDGRDIATDGATLDATKGKMVAMAILFGG